MRSCASQTKYDEECIICNVVTTLQELPCKHKYCILCVKGIINTKPTYQPALCPVCRTEITTYSSPKITIPKHKYVFVWLYQGRNNGWWIFDDEMQEKLSLATESFTWLLSGQEIRFDIVNMIQENLETGSVRFIKRIHIDDIDQYLIKGISGLISN